MSDCSRLGKVRGQRQEAKKTPAHRPRYVYTVDQRVLEASSLRRLARYGVTERSDVSHRPSVRTARTYRSRATAHS